MQSHTSMLRGRFAPTPSGHIHIGNALAALLSWLQMRSSSGAFVLRMEDIDTKRSRDQYARDIIEDLRWLGLDWDEGPDIGGPSHSYVQSQRLELYEESLITLNQFDGLLYPCFCSRADIFAAARAPHGLSSEGPVYPGTCRVLSKDDRIRHSAVKQPSLRFRVPERILSFHDGIAGPLQMQATDGGDFVVKRADGIISYQLAVVVDDALMGITDVLRGSDLLDSTPRQLLLYEKLGWKPPRFAHVPLLLDSQQRRLAKRNQSLSIAYLRSEGVLPEKVVGWLAWAAGLLNKPEPLKPSDLVAGFSLSQVTKEPIIISDEIRKSIRL